MAIIVVNWNTKDLLEKCMESVFDTTDSSRIQVVVVDNGSTDGSVEMIRSKFPLVELIQNLENTGFAKANNQAIAATDSEFVMLLNSDTRIMGGAIEGLHEFMSENLAAGAAAPLLTHPQDRFRVLSCGYQPTLRALFNHYMMLSSLFRRSRFFRGVNLFAGSHDDVVREVDWLSGACLVIRRAVIDTVGALDDSWFMYAEDMEFCDRIARAGWKLYHVPSEKVEHIGGASMNSTDAISSVYIDSLRSYFIRRETPSRTRLLAFDAIVAMGLGLRVCVYAARAVIDRPRKDLWWSETKKFFSYARRIIHIRRRDRVLPQGR